MDVQVPAFWNKFKNKFGLMQSHSEVIPLNKSIQPVSVIDDLLVSSSVNMYSAAVTGDGNAIMLTVPDGERWTIYAMRVYVSGGDFKFSTVEIIDPNTGYSVPVYHVYGSTTYTSGPIIPFYLEPGFQLKGYVHSYVSDGYLRGLFLKTVAEI